MSKVIVSLFEWKMENHERKINISLKFPFFTFVYLSLNILGWLSLDKKFNNILYMCAELTQSKLGTIIILIYDRYEFHFPVRQSKNSTSI